MHSRTTNPAYRFLQPLDSAPVQAVLTDELQVTDILQWLLDQTGPAHITQTTFSISEEYLRRLHFIREQGQILSLEMILDFKATNKTINLWIFISKIVDTAYLAENHSKIILLRTPAGRKIAVVTSQNLTRGNRNESTIIAESAEIHDTISRSIRNITDTKSIPLNDILDRTD